MNIKAYLGLEDKTSSTLKSINKAAMDTEKTFKTVTKTVYEWTDAAKYLNKAATEQLFTDKELVDQGFKVAKVIEEQIEVMNNLADAEQEVQNNTPEEPNESFDKLGASIVVANQSLELLNKAMSIFNKLQQKASEWIEKSNVEFNAEYTAGVKMHNVLGATTEEIQSMYDYASALQKVGVVGDEATISGMSTLSMYASSVDQVKKLTPAILDLAVANEGLNVTQATVESYAQRVGYALTGNATMLKRLIGASDEEVKTLNNMNDKAEKTAYLYALIERSAQGANKALAKSSEGGILQANNRLGDLQETLGKKVIPYFAQFKQLLVQILEPIVNFIAQNEWLIPVLGIVGIAIISMITILTIYTTSVKLAQIATELFGAAQTAVLGPIALVVIGIGALIGLLIYLWNTNDNVAEAMLLAWDGLIIGVKTLGLGIKTVFYAVVDLVEWAGVAILTTIQGICQIALAPINLVLGALEAIGAPGVHKIDVNFADQAEEVARQHSRGRVAELSSDAADILNYANNANATREQRVKNRQKIDGSSALDILADAQTNMSENFDSVLDTDSAGGKAIKTTSDDDLLSDDDIQLLLDVATRDYKLNYQQVTPNITLTFGDIRETVDVDDVLDRVADKLEEIYDGNLGVATT